MPIKIDEKNDMVFMDQEEYWGLVNKIKEMDMRIMKLEMEYGKQKK